MGALQVEREGATGGGATDGFTGGVPRGQSSVRQRGRQVATSGPRRGAAAVLACPEGYVGGCPMGALQVEREGATGGGATDGHWPTERRGKPHSC